MRALKVETLRDILEIASVAWRFLHEELPNLAHNSLAKLKFLYLRVAQPRHVEFVISLPRLGVPSSQAASNNILFADRPNRTGAPKMAAYSNASCVGAYET